MKFELKDQVVSLQDAKKFKKLGVPQESCFYHREYIDSEGGVAKGLVTHSRAFIHLDEKGDQYYSAFTVAELGEMIPDQIIVAPGRVVSFRMGKRQDHFRAFMGKLYQPTGRKEVDVRAKLLIYLIENNYVNPSELCR